MSDEQRDLQDMADGAELSDEALDAVAGGLVYHDPGDAHRKEAYYVLNDEGEILMRRDSLASATHWAENLRESTRVLTAEEFEKLRRGKK